MKQLILILLAGSNLAFSQSVSLTPLNLSESSGINEYVNAFSLYQLDVKNIQDILNNTKGHIYKVNLKLPERVLELELYEYTILSQNLTRTISGSKGVERLPKRTDLRTFTGIINGQNNSIVTMNIADGFLKLTIDDRKDKYYLEPYSDLKNSLHVENEVQKFIFYKQSNLKIAKSPGGQSDYAMNAMSDHTKQVSQVVASPQVDCKICAEVQIALAGDFTMFQKYGSSAAVENFFASNISDMQAAFVDAFEWELDFVITGTWVATDNLTDPFVTGGRTLAAELSTFRQIAPTIFAGSDYDVATVWSAKFISPNDEIADQGGVCTNNKYSVATSFQPGLLMGPSYVTLQAHVIGHIFNCTHDAIQYNTVMNLYPTQSLVWSFASVNALDLYVNSNGLIGNCLTICVGSGTPIPEFSADITYGCQPVTVKFKDLSKVTSKWKWRFPGGTPDSSILQNPVVVYKKAGKFPVTLEASSTRCTVALTKDEFIEINDVPIANFSYGLNGREVFFIDQSKRAVEWHWKFGDGDSSDDQTPIHSYLKDTSYEVTLIVKNDCGTDSIKKKIDVQSMPIAEFDSDTTAGCAPQLIKFFDQSTNNVVDWQWDFTGGTPSTSKLKNPVVRYDAPGSYDVRLTVYSVKFHSALSKTSYITIDSIPIANFTDTVNVGQVNFTNHSRFAKSHLWIFGDNTKSTEANPTHNYTEGTYKVVYYAINSCGIDSSITTLVIGTKPIPDFQTTNIKGCAPYQVQFQNTSSSATSYKWYFPGGNPATSTDPNPLITYNNAGKYDVSLVAYNVFYSDSIGKANFIEVRTKPSGTFTNTISGFKSSFTNSTIDGTNYLWNFGDNKISFVKDPPVHDYGVEGEFTVRLIVQNECGGDTIIKHIAVYLVPKVNFAVNSMVGCKPYKVQFFDKSSIDVVEWNWQFENGNPATSTEKNPIVIFDKIGKYTVKLTVKNSNGSNALTRTQFIQVVSTVLCPEKTKTGLFEIKENPFGIDFDNRADYINQNELKVYPNPAQDNIYVNTNANNLQPVYIDVFDLSGRKHSSYISKENVLRIQTDKLKSGTYFIKLNDGTNTSIHKFVISN